MPSNVTSSRSGRYPVTPWSEARLYRPFVLTAAALGMGGFAMGGLLLAGVVSAADAIEAHIALQIIGWCGLFVLGVAMHVVPRFHDNAPMAFPWPQRASLGLVAGGLCVGATSHVTLVAGAGGSTLGALSAVATAAGLLVAAATLSRVLRHPTTSARPITHWLWLGLAGASLTALLYAGHGVVRVASDAGATPFAWRRAYEAAALYLFILPFAFGVTARALAGLLAWRPRRVALDRVAAATLGVGGTAVVCGELLRLGGLSDLGTVAVAAAILAFLGGVRAVEPPMKTTAPAWFRRLILLAHLWLACAALVSSWSALSSGELLDLDSGAGFGGRPALHMLTVGYVTTLIVVVAARLIPLFEGRPLRSTGMIVGAAAALSASTAIRVLDATMPLPTGADGVAATLGALGYVAGVAPLVRLLMTEREDVPATRRAARYS